MRIEFQLEIGVNLGGLFLEFKVLNYCEIDKQASKSYSTIHNVNEEKNLGDICNVEIEKLPIGFTLLTHGSPCTSFSNAGLRLGGDRGSGTPSSLMWNSVEIIRHCKPKFVLWENVPAVLQAKHKHNFDEYISELDEIGYNSYYKVLNAKDFNCPQNRNRIFVLSIRKDIDKGYIFPDTVSLKITLSDVLEKDVDKKFYLTEKQIERIHTTKYHSGNTRIQRKNWCDTLCARDWKDPKCIEDVNGIRKLTPREYWRIQCFSDSDFDKAQSCGMSNSALYKQAGNSISYNVLKEIFINLKLQYGVEFTENLEYLSLFSGIGAFEMVLRDM